MLPCRSFTSPSLSWAESSQDRLASRSSQGVGELPFSSNLNQLLHLESMASPALTHPSLFMQLTLQSYAVLTIAMAHENRHTLIYRHCSASIISSICRLLGNTL
ncbi:hypothetical protein M758_UG232600 [Ceratodon purpureus]|nr:hypothetical protein M758_UG232600 [Ceratodon purpureus]